jgi:hypothetical protein
MQLVYWSYHRSIKYKCIPMASEQHIHGSSIKDLKKKIDLVYILIAVLIIAVIWQTARCRDLSAQLSKDEVYLRSVNTGKLDITEPDGTVKLSLFSKENLPPKKMNDTGLARTGDPSSGLIFYNDDGEECGGLLFSGQRDGGNRFNFYFDKYKQDPSMQLLHEEGDLSKRSFGNDLLIFSDKPDHSFTSVFPTIDSIRKNIKEPTAYKNALLDLRSNGAFGFDRLELGRRDDKTVGLFLNDARGRRRLKICIDSLNEPKICFYNERGVLINEIGSQGKEKK